MKATPLFTADVNNLVQNDGAWVQGSASTVIGMPNPLLANVLTELGLPDVMLVAGIAMVMIFLMGRLRRRGKQPAPTRLSVHESMEKQRQMRALNTDMEQVMVEIQQMARQVSAQLDAKAAHLEQLMKEADQRLKRLEEMQAGGIAKQSSPQGHGSDGTPAGNDIKATTNTDAGQDNGRNNALDANRADNPDPLALQVYQLADRGLAPAAIAGELHEHIGKIELILALRQT